MTDIIIDIHPDDFDDGRPVCEKCGKPLTSDEDGDGVMTAAVYFCESCPDYEPTPPPGG